MALAKTFHASNMMQVLKKPFIGLLQVATMKAF